MSTLISGFSGPVVLVLYNAGPLDISWAKSSERVMAIVEHFFPAQTAGVALANILNGTYNPSGRLPNTWPASLDQVRRLSYETPSAMLKYTVMCGNADSSNSYSPKLND